MADSIKTLLAARGVLNHVVLTSEIELILSALEVESVPSESTPGILLGQVKLMTALNQSPLPGLHLSLAAPNPLAPAPFKLMIPPAVAPDSFKFWLILSKQGQLFSLLKFFNSLPGFAFTGASLAGNSDGTFSLTPLPGADPKSTPALVSRSAAAGTELAPSLLIEGSAAAPASMRFTPDTDPTEGIISLGLEPRTVVFGTSQIGFDLPALVFDDSAAAKAPGSGAPGLDPPIPSIPADEVAWHGILARQLDFYLPAGVPLFGGRPIKGYYAMGFGQSGAELVIESKVPAQPATASAPAHLGYSIRIECRDPTAKGMSGLLPTLVTATLELPLDGQQGAFTDDQGAAQGMTFAAGKPVIVTATFARNPLNGENVFRISLSVSAQGSEGILSVTSTSPGGAKIFNTAAAMATALIADKNLAQSSGDMSKVALYGLLAAGTALSSLFSNDSKFVLHGAEIEAGGHGSPVGGPVAIMLDYSVALRVLGIGIGVLSVSMSPDQPMRIRVRKARLSIDPTKSGLRMIDLDFDRASMEIENPGAWNVEGLQQLFDVVRSRSGRGSSWIEVDLRFKLNLGPIKVSGATIRGTLQDDGGVIGSIRGLEAGLDIPGAIDASGGLQMIAGGFSANLTAKIIPLNLTADASVSYAPPKLVLTLGVDLPAPIPLANSGFALFGIGGVFGIAAVPKLPADADPILQQLRWQPTDPDAFAPQAGQFTFGFDAAVGTLPDLGFSFSAKASLLITAPDIAVRGALNGRIMQPPVKVTEASLPLSAISFAGFISVDREALAFGVLGQVDLRPLLLVRVPIAGRFPFKPDTSDWYLYLGADGSPEQGRAIGPISTTVLPDILGLRADAYLMMRGNGIVKWPHGRPMPGGPISPGGFIVAFGFALQSAFGPPLIAWAELYVSVDILVGAKPPTLAGFGRAGGSLNLGPFSLGVQAQVAFIIAKQQEYFWAEVTGKIELLFFDVEGTVTISYGSEPQLKVPDPDRHPLDLFDKGGNPIGSVGSLTDDTYRVVARLVEDPALITDGMRVWPDAMISLPFGISPQVQPSATAQFPAVAGGSALPAAPGFGNDMLRYIWTLDRVELFDVTDEADLFTGTSKKPSGQLAARWQIPRVTSAPNADVSELVLFSTSADLWVNRLADSGEGSNKPLRDGANICQRSVKAERGWAVGYLAAQSSGGFRLPPDPNPFSMLQSRVEANMRHFAFGPSGPEIRIDRPSFLPSPFSLVPAALVTWPSSVSIERPFVGHLLVPTLSWLPGQDMAAFLGAIQSSGQRIDLVLSEPIFDGHILLVADPLLFQERDRRGSILVYDDNNSWAFQRTFPLPTGETAALFAAPAHQMAGVIHVSWPLNAKLGIIGVSGMTQNALVAAAAENANLAAAAAAAAAAAQAGPKIDHGTNTPNKRAILDPGRLYRLDIDMGWSGKLYTQDKSGQPVLADERPDPKVVPPPPPQTRKLFFKTTPKPPPTKTGDPTYGAKTYVKWLNTAQDNFRPEMIQRYLAGYEPAQSEEHRFCDDPLRTHFTQDHVVALAKAYGFDLKVAVRRVDRGGPAYANPKLFTPIWSFGTNKAFLTDTDALRLKYAAESPCSVPTPGTTGTVSDQLEPEALYEIYVLADALDAGVADGELPGVTFRTSRWRTPADMLRGLGFAAAGQKAQNIMVGDLSIPATALSPAVAEDDDSAYDAALLALGLDGWPLAEAPRLSRLWVEQADAWKFAGLMIESPEPIHRPGRLTLKSLALSMGHAGSAVTFDIRRRDRSGSRLIYLTSSPFTVITRERIGGPPPFGGHFISFKPTLTLSFDDLAPAGLLAGTITLPPLPMFAEEP